MIQKTLLLLHSWTSCLKAQPQSCTYTTTAKIEENLKAHFKNYETYHEIPLGSSLLLIGKDGFYPYDSSDIDQVKFFIKFPTERKNI